MRLVCRCVRYLARLAATSQPLVAGMPAVQHFVRFHQRMGADGAQCVWRARANSFSLAGSETRLGTPGPYQGIDFLAGGHRSSFGHSVCPSGRQGTCFCFVENVAAGHPLQKGYSKDPSFTRLLGAFWTWVAARSLHLPFHRVTSAPNLSDGISRGDFSQLRSLQCQEPKPLFHRAYELLYRFAAKDEHERSLFANLRKSSHQHAHEGGNSAREWRKTRCSAVQAAVRQYSAGSAPSVRRKRRPKPLGRGKVRKSRASTGVFVVSLSCSARVHVGTSRAYRERKFVGCSELSEQTLNAMAEAACGAGAFSRLTHLSHPAEDALFGCTSRCSAVQCGQCTVRSTETPT